MSQVDLFAAEFDDTRPWEKRAVRHRLVPLGEATSRFSGAGSFVRPHLTVGSGNKRSSITLSYQSSARALRFLAVDYPGFAVV